MPYTALLRNLNRFSKAGLTKGNSDTTKEICFRLRHKESIAAAKIHPLNMLISMRTYAGGVGMKSSSEWEVNQNIVDALNDAFQISLEVVPTNKEYPLWC